VIATGERRERRNVWVEDDRIKIEGGDGKRKRRPWLDSKIVKRGEQGKEAGEGSSGEGRKGEIKVIKVRWRKGKRKGVRVAF